MPQTRLSEVFQDIDEPRQGQMRSLRGSEGFQILPVTVCDILLHAIATFQVLFLESVSVVPEDREGYIHVKAR